MVEWKQPPKLRDDLITSEQTSDDQTVYIINDPITYKYFRLREPEYYLVRQFDGQSDFETIAARFRDKFKLNVSADAVAAFAAKIDDLCFFEGSKAEYEISSGRYLSRTKKSLLSRLLFIKLTAFNPDKMLAALMPVARVFFHPLSLAAMIAVIIAGFAVYSANFESFLINPKELFSLGSIIILMFSLAVIILLHELAHAFTCKYFGGQVREMGFLLLYFQFCFFTNLSDSWMFTRKYQRLAVLWAGIFFQMVVFALCVFCWRITVVGTAINYFFWISTMMALFTLLFNFNPLIKLDAYYFLSEWVDIPNLRSKSFAYFRYRFKRLIGLEIPHRDYSRREKKTFARYMVLAGLYSVALIVIVGIIVYHFLVDNLGGFGFILFLLLLVLIFRSPVDKGIRFFLKREVIRAVISKKRNIIVGGIIIIALIIVLFLVPFPRRVGGDVIVRPSSEFTITLYSAMGLLELKTREGGVAQTFNTEHIRLSTGDLAVIHLTPLVKEGDAVAQGDTLAAIMSNQVSSSLDAARADLERLRGQLALAKSPPKPEEIESAQAAVNAARATVLQLEKDIERNTSLFEKKLIARQDLEQSESLLNISRSKLEETEARLRLLQSPPKKEEISILESQIASQEANISYLMSQESAQVITSPISGIITAYYRDDLLMKVAHMSQVEIAIPVIDNYLEFIEPDAKVHLRVRTFPDTLFDGTVGHIASSADATMQKDDRSRFAIHAMLDNSHMMLRDGMSGYAKISCGEASLFEIMYERLKSYIRVEFWSWW